MSRVYLAVISMLFAQNLAAQGTVVRPEPALDAGRAALRDVLLQFRDSLSSIDAAASRLQRDYRQTSTASLLSRARVMHEACARSVRNLPPTRQAVLAADAADERRLRRRGEMVGALDQLQKALARCEAEFGVMSRPGEGERVRGYGNDRAVRLQAAVRRYERVLGTFFSAMNIKVSPLGVETRPVAG
ncbi:MAG: hypothetical protein ABJB95_09585 [Gemmatimonadales bacterium]